MCFPLTPENIETQSWVTKTVWQGVLRRQPHRRSGLATLPSVGAVP